MKKKRKSRSRNEWQQIISIFEQSGLGRKDFCAQHDLGSKTFKDWYYRLRQNKPTKLVPILNSNSSAIGTEENGLGHVKMVSAETFTSKLCATLPQGIRLEFDSDLTPAYLKQIISAIKEC